MAEIIFKHQGVEFSVANKGNAWSAESDGIAQTWFPKREYTLEKALLELEVMIEDNELPEKTA